MEKPFFATKRSMRPVLKFFAGVSESSEFYCRYFFCRFDCSVLEKEGCLERKYMIGNRKIVEKVPLAPFESGRERIADLKFSFRIDFLFSENEIAKNTSSASLAAWAAFVWKKRSYTFPLLPKKGERRTENSKMGK